MQVCKRCDPFYVSAAWRSVREQALLRDHYECQYCVRKMEMGQAVKVNRATMVHHIKPRKQYPELALCLDNLISLCDSCHNKEHPERGFRSAEKAAPARRCVTIRNDFTADRS